MNGESQEYRGGASRPTLAPEQPYSEDKRLNATRDGLNLARESLSSMRQQRDELNWNIRQAEESLGIVSSELLQPTKAARIG